MRKLVWSSLLAVVLACGGDGGSGPSVSEPEGQWNGPVKDVVLIGKGQSQMEDILAEEAAKQGRYVTPEGHPERGPVFSVANIMKPGSFDMATIQELETQLYTEAA